LVSHLISEVYNAIVIVIIIIIIIIIIITIIIVIILEKWVPVTTAWSVLRQRVE